jgi:hypothetical protein
VLLKVFFGSQAAPGVIAAQIKGCRDRYQQDLVRYLHLQQLITEVHGVAPDSPYFLMAVRYGIAEARAMLAWADESLLALEEAGMSHGEQKKLQASGEKARLGDEQ